MAVSESMRGTLDELRAREKKLLDEVNALRFTIRNLERLSGIEARDSSNIEMPADEGIPAKEPAMASFNGANGKVTIRPDEFFGLTHAEAARRYLKRVGFAVSFKELVEVLRNGGCKLTSSDPEHVLWISLIKNSKDFVPPQPGYVGLRDFYPTRARPIAEKPKTKAATKKRTTAKKSKPVPKHENVAAKPTVTEHAAEPEPGKSGEVGQAIYNFIGDKKPHSVEEVAEAVSKKLGRQIKVIAIRGTLNKKNKRVEETDGKFRLVS
jgi:hypothetical protein